MELLGTTVGIILTAVAAVVGLAVFIGAVFWADAGPGARRLKVRRRGKAAGSGPVGKISTEQGERPWEQVEHRQLPQRSHPHGKPASWVLVVVVVAAFGTGGMAIIGHAWWLLWTCAGLVVLAIPAGKLIGIMDDTIALAGPPAAIQDPPQDQQAEPEHEQPVPARR